MNKYDQTQPHSNSHHDARRDARRPDPYSRNNFALPSREPRVFVQEDVLQAEQFSCERKDYTLEYRRNMHGDLVRINEISSGRRHQITVPLAALPALLEALSKVTTNIPPAVRA